MAQYEGPNRRRFRRAAVDFPVTVILPGQELVIEGRALDLSAGGLRVATLSDLPAGQSIVLRFVLPNSEHEGIVRGRIVLSFFDAAMKQYAHGIAFTRIAPESRDEIEKLLDEKNPVA